MQSRVDVMTAKKTTRSRTPPPRREPPALGSARPRDVVWCWHSARPPLHIPRGAPVVLRALENAPLVASSQRPRLRLFFSNQKKLPRKFLAPLIYLLTCIWCRHPIARSALGISFRYEHLK